MPKHNAFGDVVDNVKDVAGKVVSGVLEAVSPADTAPHNGVAAKAAIEPVDATALLEKDHQEVKALFAEADALSDTAYGARLKIFKKIDAALTLHTQVEEQIFYPAVKAKTKRNTEERDEVLEAYEEHAGAKDLIAKLERLDPRDETYKAKLQVLGEMIRHHVQEEETVLFPQARAALGHTELEALGRQIQIAKQKAAGKSPAPKTGGAKAPAKRTAAKRTSAKTAPAKSTAARGRRSTSSARTRTTAKKRAS
jgi:iron-sulfur cluster repair protein YtfE (RIC family)